MNLMNKRDAVRFYDDRYAQGYMEEWPLEEKQRVLDVIKSLDLPETGMALDFGCGNGFFTDVIKQALPQWDVYGVDISPIAVNKARTKYPHCSFSLVSHGLLDKKGCDFLLTHHVLEHVLDVAESWRVINSYGKSRMSILHILPCGNKGSFEYNLCALRVDGIDKEQGGRFVFEDNGHLRRLTAEQMNDFAASHGFKLVFDLYNYQFFGAIDWISLGSFLSIIEMTDFRKSKDGISALKLMCLRGFFLLLKCMRVPANAIDYKRTMMNRYKYYLFFMMLFVFYPISKLTNVCLRHLTAAEWKRNNHRKNGSEMYLYYTRCA
ncbi:MAG: methyltransferase domain-containing protein [Candidatus Omnitrophica bacterium]|nr:methyltransferase domain-containing protein [Candidatus Omnitrophota bacterium]